ncbi:hypothetical protein [Streptomyces sp. SID11385]|nr:hypothetical protein [Streptomyces sp. SID11385]NEA41381.1 hypothetical protein [Streptomyces sp. SID11385]
MTAPEDEPGADGPWTSSVSGTVDGTVVQAGRVCGGINVFTEKPAP